MNGNQVYSDGIQNVSIYGGVVRIDLFVLTPDNDANGKPKREFQQRVLMSPEAFLQSFGALDRVVQQLKDKGLVTARSSEEAPRKEGGKGGKSKSPNF